VIDTSKLPIVSGSQTTYTVTITAQEPGFQSVENTDLTITVIKNDAYINETYNDDSIKSNYWLEDINMTVQPYGENSEYLYLEYEIFKHETNNYQQFDIDFSIPDLTTEWNLSYVEFDIYRVTHGIFENMELNITDPYNNKKSWNNDSIGNYYFYSDSADNGTWTDLIVDLNKASPTLLNSFNFTIEGSFIGPVDIVATAYFLRNKISTEYSLFNISDYIIIPSDGNGWVIKNITFELYNCRDPSDWSQVDPSTSIEMIRFEGINYTVDSFGKVTIDNMTIYPTDDQFLFSIIEISDIMFDLNVTIEYMQGFYWNPNLENISATFTENDFIGGNFEINCDDENLNNLENILLITDIHNATDTFSPADIAMNITFILPGGDITYSIGELGTFSLLGFNTNFLYNAFIETLEPVNFTLTFLSTNLRIVDYKISGAVNFEATTTYKGSVSYDEDLETYLLTLDTSLLNAQLYTVVFTFSSTTHETAIKNMNIEVLERETSINNRLGAYQLITSIPVQTETIFSFTYLDVAYGTNVTDLDLLSYEWEYYGEGSSILSLGEGQLSVDSENRYILDFNTQLRAVGRYQLIATLKKQNYETKIGIISLLIEEREIDYDLGDMFEEKQVSVVKGKTVILEIELTDIVTGQPLTGAKVVLEIGNEDFEFDEEDDGVYELEFNTEDYEAFFTSNILTGTIKISKANYTTEDVDITIVVEMEEVVDGVPTFYFLMIVGAIAAVFGSLITYRFIQIARIPEFVKKTRAMKKAIKNKADIPQSSLTKSKEEYIFNEFGDEWEEIGLSLKYVLGINGKRRKSVIESGKLSESKGGAE
jgi:hypothetical protein